MKNSLNQLQTELSVMTVNNSRLQEETNKLKIKNEAMSFDNSRLQHEVMKIKTEDKKCPKGWARFGSSCYYKSAFIASWDKSRIICQNQGSDLMIINSKVEQCFITDLNENGESWIGLEVGWSSQKNKYGWIWLDGSPLTESFQKTENLQDPTDYFTGVYLKAEGKWKSLHKTHEKTFICEKIV
ncbi:CD209 antigen-like protein E [Oryzias melastigma]|nr:CD209 antigen-like protein E [Oryzias melastigma]